MQSAQSHTDVIRGIAGKTSISPISKVFPKSSFHVPPSSLHKWLLLTEHSAFTGECSHTKSWPSNIFRKILPNSVKISQTQRPKLTINVKLRIFTSHCWIAWSCIISSQPLVVWLTCVELLLVALILPSCVILYQRWSMWLWKLERKKKDFYCWWSWERWCRWAWQGSQWWAATATETRWNKKQNGWKYLLLEMVLENHKGYKIEIEKQKFNFKSRRRGMKHIFRLVCTRSPTLLTAKASGFSSWPTRQEPAAKSPPTRSSC